MMFRYSLIFLSLAFALLPQAVAPGTGSATQTVMVPAPALTGNLLGDASVQKAIVYLPPGYTVSRRRYPVLYLLHGFSLHPVLPDWEEVTRTAMDSFVRANPEKALIVVIPNGANKVDGSYYMDSAVAGGWETYVSKDLIAFVDSHFRTLADRRSRAVAGHSMGGFGTLRMLLLHPDIFSVGYAISPCCLDFVADMTSENAAWSKVLDMRSVDDIQRAAAEDDFWATALAAFAIAASPDPNAALKADVPYRRVDGQIVAVPAEVERWKAQMPLNLIESHILGLRQAAGIAIDYGYQDEFAHIPLTSREFAEKLLALHVPVVLEGYNGDHNNGIPARVRTRIVPFIADHLRFQP
jgi:S-formylglutathione hydrolase FrmB